MNYEREAYMRRQEEDHDMIRMRSRRTYDSTGCADAMCAQAEREAPEFQALYDVDYLRERYRLVCFALCERMGIKPDEIIADSGEEAWQLVGFEEANKILNSGSRERPANTLGTDSGTPGSGSVSVELDGSQA